ncbi:MAG: 1-acyl-sn-glycerol-3-phosphate acyltransferase [Thermoanaerobaculia bacterium]
MTEQGIPTLGQSAWRRFCQLAVKIFYRRFEVAGADRLPAKGPVLVCANHVNALVDGVVLQAACERPLHPLARSGLFRTPIFRPILKILQAVPVYRRRDTEEPGTSSAAERTARNVDSFQRCYDYFGGGRALMIFPEGQSHSDPRLRSLKTGAARLALGSRAANGELPAIVPVGLTFTHKGRFRSNVLVQFGDPVELEEVADEPENATVRRLTERIGEGLEKVTLNTDSWEDLALIKLLQDFFTLRRQRGARDSLSERFRSFQRLIEAHRLLRMTHPDQVEILRRKLHLFSRLRERFGVRDYQLHLRYRPVQVLLFLLRSLFFALVIFPLALWGFSNSALPYFATRRASLLAARGRDQYDTAGMLFGLLFFLLFWGGQSAAVWWYYGLWPTAAYMASLPITAALALLIGHQRRRIVEEVRVFLLFLRKKEVRSYLQTKRQELEEDLAQMTRLARRELADNPQLRLRRT